MNHRANSGLKFRPEYSGRGINQNTSTQVGLTKKYEKKSFSQSFAEFNAESRKDKNLIINILRNSAVHQRDSARNKKELFRQPPGG